MARFSTAIAPSQSPDPTSINLTRLIARLQQTLNSPDSNAEAKLRSSSIERERAGNVSTYEVMKDVPTDANTVTESRLCERIIVKVGARGTGNQDSVEEGGNTNGVGEEEGSSDAVE